MDHVLIIIKNLAMYPHRSVERTNYKLNIDLPSFTGNLHIEDFLDGLA